MQIPGKSCIIPKKLVSIWSPSGFQKGVCPFFYTINFDISSTLKEHKFLHSFESARKSSKTIWHYKVCYLPVFRILDLNWTWVTQVIGDGTLYSNVSNIKQDDHQQLSGYTRKLNHGKY
jgi:hypothetical protein